MPKGKLIVFEGPEGCGKGTQIKRVEEYLTSHNVRHCSVREPGHIEEYPIFRQLLLHATEVELHPMDIFQLFNQDRRLTYLLAVLPALRKGMVVLSDRNFCSSIVYQGLVDKLEIPFIIRESRRVTQVKYPDLTLIFDVTSANRALTRAQQVTAQQGHNPDRFEGRGLEYAESVVYAYRGLPVLLRDEGLSKKTELIPPGTPDQTFEKVRTHLDQLLDMNQLQ